MLTPEECREPRVLRAARAAAGDVAASADASLQSAVLDPEVHARVAAAAPPRGLPRGAKAEADAQLVERAPRPGRARCRRSPAPAVEPLRAGTGAA
jgi:hypothetical protein